MAVLLERGVELRPGEGASGGVPFRVRWVVVVVKEVNELLHLGRQDGVFLLETLHFLVREHRVEEAVHHVLLDGERFVAVDQRAVCDVRRRHSHEF